MASGLAENPMEIEKAVASILPIADTPENNVRKRNYDQINSDNDTNQTTLSPNEQVTPKTKKLNQIRFYKNENKGPYEIIIQDKNKVKLNPFHIGKIIKNHYTDVDYIKRSGRNISVFCRTPECANNLVRSDHLSQYNAFIPSIRVYTTGVANIDSNITESEILTESECENTIIDVVRIKKRINQELRDTNYVKVTFDSDTLPDYFDLNYVRVKVEPYIIPVKQCYRCFSYGHVASAPCRNDRLCRNCGDQYHSTECELTRKCIHCFGPHCSNSKLCPEFIRQKNIKERMSILKEDYFTASQFFPITYKNVRGKRKGTQSFSQVARSLDLTNKTEYPELPQISPSSSQISFSNRYSPLSTVSEIPIKSDNTGHKVTFRKPSFKSNNTPNKPVQPKNSRPNTKFNTTKPITTNPIPKSSQTQTTQFDHNYYKQLVNAKLTEIRNKVKSTNITSKKQMDDLLETFINSEQTTKSIVSLNKINEASKSNRPTSISFDKKDARPQT